MKQLYELSRKFPKDWIKKAPKGKFGNYVPHPVITQRLLEVCGPFDWEVVELIRQETTGSVVGCFGKLTVEIDGKLVTVTSIGEIGEHTSELQSHHDLVCRLLLEKKKKKTSLTQKQKKKIKILEITKQYII